MGRGRAHIGFALVATLSVSSALGFACSPSNASVDANDATTVDVTDANTVDARSDGSDAPGDGTQIEPTIDRSRLDDSLDSQGLGLHVRRVALPAGDVTFIVQSGAARIVDVDVEAPDGTAVTFRGTSRPARAWFRPRLWDPVADVEWRVEVRVPSSSATTGPVTLRMRSYGATPAVIDRDRSLVWTDPTVIDDPAVVGLARVMRAASSDGHGGRLFEALMRRFGTTLHSERAGPVQFVDEVVVAQGRDPSRWNLDALPFRVTAVHNRVDLSRGADCGEFRVSIASTHSTYHPFHLIFLFRQAPGPDDIASNGEIHCTSTAQAWAHLSTVDAATFRTRARALLDVHVTHARFLLAESVEFTISPWEWRQWQLVPNPDIATRGVLPEVFDNIPLFQTVDTEGLNLPSARRTRFLDWVTTNADAVNTRTIEIPADFRALSARVTQGIPRTPLDLTGVATDVRTRLPQLRQNLEIVGCPTCHSTDAPFVQTLPDRTFSPFYATELMARARFLFDRVRGSETRAPFGPLQPNPVLPM